MGDAGTDGEAVRVAGGERRAVAAVLAAADAAARGYANRSRAGSTWRAYEADWRRFASWCAAAALQPLPATPRTLALFLAAEASPSAARPDGLAPATLRRRLAAIRLMHLGAGHLSPHAAPEVGEVLRGIANARADAASRGAGEGTARGGRGGRKRPVLESDLRGMVDAFDPGTRVGLRDRALLLVGFAAALRRSELVALDVTDLEWRAEGLLITVVRSKGDQAGAGQVVAVPAQPGSAHCPVAALERWLRAAGIRAGALFRRFYRGDVPSPHRLSAQSVALVVKRGARAIGRDPDELGAHSLRHGFLTQAARNGADIFRMAAQSRHRDVRTVMGYVQDERRFEAHPGREMLRAAPPPTPAAVSTVPTEGAAKAEDVAGPAEAETTGSGGPATTTTGEPAEESAAAQAPAMKR